MQRCNTYKIAVLKNIFIESTGGGGGGGGGGRLVLGVRMDVNEELKFL